MGLQSLPITQWACISISTSSRDVRGRGIRWLVGSARAEPTRSPRSSPGWRAVLERLIAGGALAGIAIAGVAAAGRAGGRGAVPAADYLADLAWLQGALGSVASNDIVALAVFAGMAAVLYRVASR
jgi:hypothetical protein